MVFIAELAVQQGILAPDVLAKHRQILMGMGLPISYDRDAWDSLYRNLALDKKARGNSIRFVAISDIGKTLRLEGLSESELRSAYEKISK